MAALGGCLYQAGERARAALVLDAAAKDLRDSAASAELSFHGGLEIVELPKELIDDFQRLSWENRVLLFSGLSPWPLRCCAPCVALAGTEDLLITLLLPEWRPNVPTIKHALEIRRKDRPGG